jgi:hypothetical protein
MAEPTFQEEDYPINKHGLSKLLFVAKEATEDLEAGLWDQEKLQRFATLITSHPGRWQQAASMIWQLRSQYDVCDHCEGLCPICIVADRYRLETSPRSGALIFASCTNSLKSTARKTVLT